MREQQARFRIGTDRRSIRWSEGTGVARYRDGLGTALGLLDADIEPVGDGGEGAARIAALDLPRALRRKAGLSRQDGGWVAPDLYRLAQRHFTLTGRLLELVADDPPALVHWSHPMPLRLGGSANLYTVHDLIPLETPRLTGMSRARQARLLTRLVDSAAQLVTVSETVRSALMRRFGLDETRVTCCYQAVDAGPEGALPDGLTPGGYFLAIGRVESRKNIVRLLRAHDESDTRLPLVVAGPEGHWVSPAERREAAALMQASGVIRLGWQKPATAAALIAQARAVLMPSLAEGFGLPAIEAMRVGVPAMTSDSGAAAEIAGDAALAVDPLDIDAIAAGILALERDEALRTTLIARGDARARNFSIQSFAARLGPLYQRFT